MSGKSIVFLVIVIAAAVCASPSTGPSLRHTMHQRTQAPASWLRVARATENEQVRFVVALKQTNLEKLESLFWEVSDPTHAKYAQYLSAEEVNAMVAAKPATVSRVNAWLKEHDIAVRVFADAIQCVGRVADVEKLLATEFHVFRHAATGKRVVKQWGAYSVPQKLSEDVELIEGVGNFPIERSVHVAEVTSTSQDKVVPYTLLTQYNVSADGSSDVSHSAIEFQNDASFSPDDLASFWTQVNEPAITVAKEHIVGPFSPTYPDTESQLDVEYLAAVGGKSTPNWFWTEADWMYSFAQKVSNTQTVPLVMSMSWGWAETGQCDIDQTECSQLGVNSAGYIKRVNTEFQKIGLRGVTLVVASGDAGANSRLNEQCTQTSPPLNPDFPASSPYVTTVGATQLGANTKAAPASTAPACQDGTCAESGDEVACSSGTGALITSGGGFSNVAAQPAYQSAAVKAYLNGGTALPPAKYFNASGRAYPDVAALGHNYLVYIDGGMEAVDGTSCAAPVFSGVLSQINAHLVANGGKPIGFANPLLYKMPASAFNDITKGDNKCTEQTCCQYGYETAAGWDPVTGLGTPNLAEMIKHVDGAILKKAGVSKLRG